MILRRSLLLLVVVAAVLTALLGVSLGAPPLGVAQEASPQASPEACPEASPVGSPTASPAANAQGTPCPEGTPSAAGDTLTVEAGDIYFEPRELTIPADTEVTISIPNVGSTLHTFVIDELGVNVEMQPGETGEAVINAPAGEYEYYCSVPGHRQAGQWGTLTVQ